MRDPDRIPIILEYIQHEWEEHPDWRFGQLMFNLLNGIWDTPEPRFFYLEDDLLIQRLLGETIEVD